VAFAKQEGEAMWGKCTAVVAVLGVGLGILQPMSAAKWLEHNNPQTTICYGNDCVVWHATLVEMLSADRKQVWVIHFDLNPYMDGGVEGGLVEVPGGDIIAFRYNVDEDSGADLVRLNRGAGAVVWKTRCAPMEAQDSEEGDNDYLIRIAVHGSTLRVICSGSGGNFVEVLDLASGRQLKRTQALIPLDGHDSECEEIGTPRRLRKSAASQFLPDFLRSPAATVPGPSWPF
jgi:hypothetical protein